MPRPEDRVCLLLPTPEGSPEPYRKRWWWIVQPPPSVAFCLQARVFAALGDAVDPLLRAFLADEQDDADFAAVKATTSEALALRAVRRARSGRAVAEAGDLRECADRLWAVLRFAATHHGGVGDPLALLGEPERAKGGPGHRWTRPSLLHRVLLESGLRHDGEGPAPQPAVPATLPADAPAALVARAALRDAVAEGSQTAFSAALDGVLASPDEFALLAAWAVLHLLRPF